MLKLVNMAEPPLRMPFGSDTVLRIEEKNASVARKLARMRDLALSLRILPLPRRDVKSG